MLVNFEEVCFEIEFVWFVKWDQFREIFRNDKEQKV